MFETKSCLIINQVWDAYEAPLICGVLEPGNMQTLFCILKSIFGEHFKMSYSETLGAFETIKKQFGAADIWDNRVIENLYLWLEDEDNSILSFDLQDYYFTG